jgi:tetratricopeptide (TPR) repeat protein
MTSRLFMNRSDSRPSSLRQFVWRIASTVVLLLVFAMGWVFALRSLASDIAMTRSSEIYESLAGKDNNTPRQDGLSVLGLALAEHAVSLDPGSPLAAIVLTQQLTLQERYAKAATPAAMARRLLSSVETLRQLGSIRLKLSDVEGAREAFEEALDLYPPDKESLENMVWVSQRRRSADDMLRYLRALDSYHGAYPDGQFLWTQYWRELARALKRRELYAAGLRAASLAANLPPVPGSSTIFQMNQIPAYINYFQMGARDPNSVKDNGEPFASFPPVSTRGLKIPQ